MMIKKQLQSKKKEIQSCKVSGNIFTYIVVILRNDSFAFTPVILASVYVYLSCRIRFTDVPIRNRLYTIILF
jgi:hypothetical protein